MKGAICVQEECPYFGCRAVNTIYVPFAGVTREYAERAAKKMVREKLWRCLKCGTEWIPEENRIIERAI